LIVESKVPRRPCSLSPAQESFEWKYGFSSVIVGVLLKGGLNRLYLKEKQNPLGKGVYTTDCGCKRKICMPYPGMECLFFGVDIVCASIRTKVAIG